MYVESSFLFVTLVTKLELELYVTIPSMMMKNKL